MKNLSRTQRMTADLAFELARQLELAAFHISHAVETLKAHGQAAQRGQVEQCTLEAPVIIDGRINGTLRLDADERAWSS